MEPPLSLFTVVAAGTLFARLVVGGVFLIAGLAKLKTRPGQFLSAILGYDLLPAPVAIVFARWLPYLEVAAGGLLIVGLGSRYAATLGVGLLLVFSSAVAISLLRGKDQACGCFRSLTPVQWHLVYRNLILMGLLLPVYALRGGAWALDNWLTPQANAWFQLSTGLAALTMVWLLTLSATLLLQWLTRKGTPVGKTVGLRSQ